MKSYVDHRGSGSPTRSVLSVNLNFLPNTLCSSGKRVARASCTRRTCLMVRLTKMSAIRWLNHALSWSLSDQRPWANMRGKTKTQKILLTSCAMIPSGLMLASRNSRLFNLRSPVNVLPLVNCLGFIGTTLTNLVPWKFVWR
jgi:hypothetical protein